MNQVDKILHKPTVYHDIMFHTFLFCANCDRKISDINKTKCPYCGNYLDKLD